jgi:hypothetical protein
MKLTRNERCPVHKGNRVCCGRTSQTLAKSFKRVRIGPEIFRHTHTGLIRRPPAAMRTLLSKKVWKQKNGCAICKEQFNAREITPDHKLPNGIGEPRRDDSEESLQATHGICNGRKGRVCRNAAEAAIKKAKGEL